MLTRVFARFKGLFRWLFTQRINFLVDGNHRRSVRRLVFRRWIFLSVTVFLAAFIGVAGYAFASRVKIEVDRQELGRLRKENRLLEKQYAQLEDEIDSISDMFADLGRHDIQLRVLANMDILSSDAQKLGIGGPEEKDHELIALKTMKSTRFQSVEDISSTVEELLRRAKYQNESFAEIEDKLTKDQMLRDHTPSIRPCNGWQCSGFGYRIDPYTKRPRMHNGVDISNASGTPILATADGTITYTGYNSGYGLAVKIDHDNELETYYAHLSSILVGPGEEIRRGQVIALMGATGRTTGTHLHYEVRIGGTAVNPLNYFIEEINLGD